MPRLIVRTPYAGLNRIRFQGTVSTLYVGYPWRPLEPVSHGLQAKSTGVRVGTQSPAMGADLLPVTVNLEERLEATT
ncbi:MAG: hypothetical protein BMS9Abin29_2327 [Gemmatimonadota bacterium]|nr:MAG: hypothetical protein BMS9Abin29_2327 [Gemmatimonadota bacterium]